MFLQKQCLVWRQPCLLCGKRNSSWTARKVRSTFTDFFSSHGHEIVPSSSVIPKKGEGTYFTNAGMNQFKPIFLGECPPSSPLSRLTRATNSQKCIRVGGKHNDLEDVGHDLTHHTFFEMLGNWSFGDYFKSKACSMAYELLTQHYKIPSDRLYFTYFAGSPHLAVPPDEECKDIWLSLGVPKERVLPFGETDNFWDMGDTGPCGPCTEIHYDHLGSRLAPQKVNTGSPQLVEIWNLVFMQYNGLPEGSLEPLPATHVDTGMGLERLAALLNGTADNYSTDLFLPLLDTIAEAAKTPRYQGDLGPLDCAYRLLADHSRMITVAISDGLLPSNDNLGHKLRSVLHRCIHLSRDVFNIDPHLLLPTLVNAVVENLSCNYPELVANKSKVCDIVSSAIEHHDRQRTAALKSFEKMASRLDGPVLSGEIIHALEQGHYGSPVSLDFISDLASRRGLQLDLGEYEKLRGSVEKEVSSSPLTRPQDPASALVRQMTAAGVPSTVDDFKYACHPLNDRLYDFSVLESTVCNIRGLSSQGEITDVLSEGQQGEVILDNTCFYAEGGGQEADSGVLTSETGKFVVTDTQSRGGYIVHFGEACEGSISASQAIQPNVFRERREGCMRNHTATHLLNSALSRVVPSSRQEGSSVVPYKLTLDFLALSPVNSQHIEEIEKIVRDAIKVEYDITRDVMPIKDAMNVPNLRTLQNEAYPDLVSVISVGQVETGTLSAELCGGTHVANTSHLMDFCVTQLSTKSQNVKRITAVTGMEAQQALLSGTLLKMVSGVLQSTNLQSPSLEGRWDHVHSTALELQRLMLARQERLEHSLWFLPECDTAQRARLEAMLAEADKSLAWTDSVLTVGTIQPKLKEHDATVPTLRAIVAILKKGKDLELMQKTARDDAHSCLHTLEHKVTEAVNERMVAALSKNVSDAVRQCSDEASLGFFVPKDFAPRQMVKIFHHDMNGLERCRQLSLAHIGKKAVTLACGVKNDGNPDQRYKEIIEMLQQLAPTKGKKVATSSRGHMRVFTFTMNSRSKQGRPVNQSLLQSHLPFCWYSEEGES